MRVLVCPADDGGSGFYRLLEPCRVLIEQGYEITVDVGATTIMCSWGEGGKMKGVDELPYEVVVFQRTLTKIYAEAIPFIQANGTAVVMELDDDLWNVDRRNVAYRDTKPSHSPDRNHDHLATACQLADLVTVSTPALAKVVPAPHVKVLRNLIPEWYLSAKISEEANWEVFEERKVVGWTGSPRTHPGDLEVMGGSLVKAVRDANAVFFSIGSPDTGRIVGFDDGESAFTQWVQLDKYPSAIAGLDVGVVPLKMTAFNESKSYLKGLEYAALGVAFVASPTSEYRYLHRLGAGELAAEKHDWLRSVSRLLRDDDYRAERSYMGKQAAESLTYERESWRWLEAWESAWTNFEKREL